MIVKNLVLRAIQKAARVQAVGGDEVSPVVLAVRKIKAPVGSAEGAVRTRYVSVGSGNPEPRACGNHDHQTSLTAILRRGRAFKDFHRLDGVDRQLVGEDLALLIRNRLAVNGKRVRGVIAKSVKEAVRVGRGSWRSQGD